jgi:RNA polymerase sigma factor (sigma-70 family)
LPPSDGPGAGAGATDDRVGPVGHALARGDRAAALTQLMHDHGEQIHRFCVSMLGERSLADDVQQAVFVQAYEALASFRGEGSWRAWLFAIARHRCLDAARARKRWRWRFLLAGDAGEASKVGAAAARAVPVSAEVEHTSETDPRGQALRDCLRALAPHVRVAVLMRYEQGLSYDEIARMSRERAPAIQARVARALPVLRDCVVSKERDPRQMGEARP